ncbi:MAG: endonuclease III, partial [Planctomycetaceae bacterium]|nr:endonuclease III [Planctomycetaceae bacterium]
MAKRASTRRVNRYQRRSLARRQDHAQQIVDRLKQEFPVAECALQHRNAYELLAATILSAQCTDERVNKVTPNLFRQYPDVQSLAIAQQA